MSCRTEVQQRAFHAIDAKEHWVRVGLAASYINYSELFRKSDELIINRATPAVKVWGCVNGTFTYVGQVIQEVVARRRADVLPANVGGHFSYIVGGPHRLPLDLAQLDAAGTTPSHLVGRAVQVGESASRAVRMAVILRPGRVSANVRETSLRSGSSIRVLVFERCHFKGKLEGNTFFFLSMWSL